MFIVIGLTMSVSIGGFIGLMFTSGMKNSWKRVVVTIIIALAIGFGIDGIITLEKKGDKKAWNNGHCECGTEWHLVNVEHLKNSVDSYYYSCDNCGNVIKTHSNFTK